MASAWNDSWGTSWGDFWGTLTEPDYALSLESGAVMLAGTAATLTYTSGTARPVVRSFMIATTDLSGTKMPYERVMAPAPSRVQYPTELAGQTVETADGRVVIQQPTRDPRKRLWIWAGYSRYITTYERQFRWLEGLRSRIKQNIIGAGSYVYVYDGVTGSMNKRRTLTLTVSAHTGQALTVGTFEDQVHPSTLKDATVEVLPDSPASVLDFERYSVLYSTGDTQLYVDMVPSGSLVGREVLLTWTEPTWWKARVVEVSRTVDDNSGAMKFTETRFGFVIEDPDWTELG